MMVDDRVSWRSFLQLIGRDRMKRQQLYWKPPCGLSAKWLWKPFARQAATDPGRREFWA